MTAAVEVLARAVNSAGPGPRVALDAVECVVCARTGGLLYPDLGVVIHRRGRPGAYQCRLPGPARRRQR